MLEAPSAALIVLTLSFLPLESSCKLPPRRGDMQLRAYDVHVSKEDGGNSEQKHIWEIREGVGGTFVHSRVWNRALFANLC